MIREKLKHIYERISKHLQTRHGQVYFLTRHFMGKLINNSLIKSESYEVGSLLVAVILFALAGALISHNLLAKYLVGFVVIEPHVVWVEKTFFMTFMMSMMGIICAVVWNNLFLDKQDYDNLLTLPIKLRNIYMTKFLSALLFVAFVSILFNFTSTVVFTAYLSQGLKINPLYFAFTHFFSNLLSNVFMFFSISTLHGIMTVLFNNRWMKSFSVYLQVIIIVGFTWIFFWLPDNTPWLLELKELESPLLYYLPPFWFTGLQETLLGSPDPVFTKLAPLAIISIIAAFGLYFLMFPLSLRKYLRRAHAAGNNLRNRSLKPIASLKRLFNKIFLRDPIQAGTFYFVLLISRRNLKVKLQLGFFMIVPIAFIASKMIFHYSRQGAIYFEEINAFLISIPLVFTFFLIAGLRGVMRYPINREANWLIRVTENQHKIHYIAGVKKAVFFFAVFPFLILLFLFYTYFWGFKPAIYHICFSTAAAILVMEVFFINYRKMPFVSSYLPGNSKFKYWGMFYIIAFIFYLWQFTALGLFLIKNPGYYLAFYPGAAMIYMLFKGYQYKKNRVYNFIYEEEPEAFFLSLGLDQYTNVQG
jgi:hypothetical protein